MDINFESSLESISDELLKYIGITNLDFKTELSDTDLEEIKNMLFSINTLMQVTFKDGTRLEDIENIKHILELSPTISDQNIEKMILRSNSLDDTRYLLSLPYANPSTWNMSYKYENGTYFITTIPNYRIMEEYISIVLSSIGNDYSNLEKIKEIYDFIKLLNYKDGVSRKIPDIINSREADSFGFCDLFREILKRVDIDSFIGTIDRNGKTEYITLVYVKDDKYNINGLYVFDPASDSVDKNSYDNRAFRKLNYNYFCIDVNSFNSNHFGDRLTGIIHLMISEDFKDCFRKANIKDRNRIRDSFSLSVMEVQDLLRKTFPAKEDSLLSLFKSRIHKEDFISVNRDAIDLLVNNYYLRKKEIYIERPKEVDSINLLDY